jgi:hypothetical protein
MAARVKARTGKGYRRRNTVIVAFFAVLSCVALIMAIYNLVAGNILFAIACVIATILAVTYVLIRVNTVFPTSVSVDKVNLYLKNWNNDFLPYDYENKVKILSEFIPAKLKIIEIPIDEIRTILIGTKNFIKRNISGDMEFVENVKALEQSKDFYRKRTISSMDIFYVETYESECYYMPIVKFEPADVMKVVKAIQRRNAAVEVKSGSKDYRALRMPKR